MPSPRISLIICCYRQRAWMDLLHTSVANQRIDVPFEVLLCDDGSSDGTAERVGSLAASLNLDLRYLWQPDRGFRLSRSRNNGLRCARGELIVFADGDCWLAPSFLADHWRAQREGPALVCGMRHTLTMTREAIEQLPPAPFAAVPDAPQAEHQQQREAFESSSPWMACLGCNVSVPALHAVDFDETFTSYGSEDRDMACRLCRAGLPVRLLPAPNMIELVLPGERERHYSHDQIVAFIENKQYLDGKYPAGELAASVDLVRHCHLDRKTNRWFVGSFRHEATARQIFEEYRAWAAR